MASDTERYNLYVWRWLAFVVAVSGCGRLSFGDHDDAVVRDVAWPTGPFGAPQHVTALADPGTDDDPTITGDALELYFASERGGAATGYADIYVSRRASIDDPWGAPAPVAELNSTAEDQSPGISEDGLTIYFSSRRPSAIAGGSANTWVATRTSRQAAWSAPALVAEVSSPLDEFEPQPDASNTHLVFYRAPTADRDLFEATRASTALPWSTPVPLAELNTTGVERSPFLSADGLSIWFSSDRDSGMAGVDDIFVATRASTLDPFGTPVVLPDLDTPADDDDPSLSADGHIMMITSARGGDYEIYEARR